METLVIVVVLCLLLGVAVGFLAGLLGIGGGLLIVPVLSTLLPYLGIVPKDQAMVVAIATSLSSIILTSSASARAHQRNDNICWQSAPWSLAGVSIGALASAWLASQLSGAVLEWIFAVIMVVIALRMAFAHSQVEGTGLKVKGWVLTPLTAIVGFLSGLVGIGGGALMVPLLSQLGVNVKKAIGTAALAGICIAIFGVMGYIFGGWQHFTFNQGFIGFVYLPALFSIALTSTQFAPKGASLAHSLPVTTLKRVFAMLLIVIAIKMLVF